jgi:V8-like Glu-specific endopeptidase
VKGETHVKGRIGRMIRLSAVLLSLVLLGSSVLAGQSPKGDAGDAIISSASDPAWTAGTREWTAERMRNAQPMPLPAMEGNRPEAQLKSVAEPTGPAGFVPGGAPGEEWKKAEATFSEPAAAPSPLGYPYPPPYTRYEIFPVAWKTYKTYPYRTVGVLFFSQGGSDWRCSASSIGNYAVWTAGHCVSDGAGTWSTNFLFIPAYAEGSKPCSWCQFTGSVAWTFTAWHNFGDFARDSGGVVLNTNSGHKVSEVGWLGFAWNWDRDQHWHQHGYPSESPFDGDRQIKCTSSHSVDDGSVSPATMGTGCDMTGGSSGGPWIKDFSGYAGASNYLNGNVSYYYIGWPEEYFSPYFDDMSHDLWDILVTETP